MTTKTIKELKEELSNVEKELTEHQIILRNIQETPVLKQYLELQKITEEGGVLFSVLQESMKNAGKLQHIHANLVQTIKQHATEPQEQEVQTTTVKDRPKADQHAIADNEFRVRQDREKYENTNVSARYDEDETQRRTNEICQSTDEDVGQDDDLDLDGLPDFEEEQNDEEETRK